MLTRFALAAAGGLSLFLALAVRIHNARRYPADWGFDASYNWQYITALTRSWHLPPPDAGWSTGDPPLYFAISALLARLAPTWLVVVPLLNVALGLVVAGFAAGLVRRCAPDDRLRAAIAGGLVLFLPAHVHMSAMVNEELLAAALTSWALWIAADDPPADAAASLRRAALCGAVAGLALLSKLTGLLTIATVAAVFGVVAWRRGEPRAGVARVAVLLGAALATGGWFYARNRILFGYFQPFGLPAHQLMFSMPPGSREWLDYLRFPLSTFTDPQLLNPDLLRSVWGSTYASVWFDAHGSFLPVEQAGVRRLGTLCLGLGLLPTAAFAVGLARGVRRAWRGSATDLPLVLLVGLTLGGFASYTWQNPWFVVIKGTTLLGLCVPYGLYASEVLRDWSRRGRIPAIAIGCALAALVVVVTTSGTFNGLFERTEVSGLSWQAVERP